MRMSKPWEELLMASGRGKVEQKGLEMGKILCFRKEESSQHPRGTVVQDEVREVGRDQLTWALWVMTRNFRFYSNQTEKPVKMVKT